MSDFAVSRSVIHHGSVALLISLLTACTPNKQLRVDGIQNGCSWNQERCYKASVERFLEYDLGFIEFTERGNLYNRDDANSVLELIHEQAQTQRGVAVIVFVHGWKHNAHHNDSNVEQFREFLSRAAENNVVGTRKVFGVYLGWRGAHTNLPLLKETTYWARKSVAEELGAGGVTEVLVKIKQAISARKKINDENGGDLRNENSYVVIGHSFGGAIVLSAMHDVLLRDLVNANPSLSNKTHTCSEVNRFADALILLNPAIEANQAVQLKEATARCRFDDQQVPLMHVLSSDGDQATRVFFPLGEFTNIASPLGPKKLEREIRGKSLMLSERELSLVTVGNIQQFRTGYLSYKENQNEWALDQCYDGLESCGIVEKQRQADHIPNDKNDPLKFIKTDRIFIKDHNDAFGCYVQGFISALVRQSQMRAPPIPGPVGSDCKSDEFGEFDLMACFNNQLDDYDCVAPD